MENYRKRIEKILKKLKNGKIEAFEDLFRATYLRLSFIAYKYLRNKNDCEDVVSEAFIAVYKSIHTFDENQNGYAWLCKIVENKALNYNRKYIDSEELTENLAQMNDFCDAVDTKCFVDSLLDELNDCERELIELRFMHDKSLISIAQEKGLTVNVVNYRITKILEKLQKSKKIKS